MIDIAVLEHAVGERQTLRGLVDEERGLHELAMVVPLEAGSAPEIQAGALKGSCR
jgi:hypothetical protein